VPSLLLYRSLKNPKNHLYPIEWRVQNEEAQRHDTLSQTQLKTGSPRAVDSPRAARGDCCSQNRASPAKEGCHGQTVGSTTAVVVATVRPWSWLPPLPVLFLACLEYTMAPTKTSVEVHAWEKCDLMVRTWLYNVIDKKLHGSIANVSTARATWVDLEERYSQGNSIRSFN